MAIVPLTVEVRATASCLEVWPTNSSLTLYPASDPVVTVQVPESPVPDEVVGEALGDERPSVVGDERRPEKK
jgi:hypothetical protein